MKELLARQQADVAVQAAANNRIVARETIKACFIVILSLLHYESPQQCARRYACQSCRIKACR